MQRVLGSLNGHENGKTVNLVPKNSSSFSAPIVHYIMFYAATAANWGARSRPASLDTQQRSFI
jgi:hypothetical protein